MPAHPTADHLAALVAQLGEALAAERQAREADRMEAARARQSLERELAAAVRAAGIAERERQGLIDLLLQQERRLLRLEAPSSPPWRARLNGVRTALSAWHARLARRRAVPTAGNDPSANAPPPRALLACVVGLDRGALALVIETVRAHADRAAARPVFLTDGLQFDLFRAARVAFEHLPSQADVAPALDAAGWRLYVARRLALLVEKWQATAIVAYGEAASQWLSEIAREPLLPPPVRALLPAVPTAHPERPLP
jgi:hypothetical protein